MLWITSTVSAQTEDEKKDIAYAVAHIKSLETELNSCNKEVKRLLDDRDLCYDLVAQVKRVDSLSVENEMDKDKQIAGWKHVATVAQDKVEKEIRKGVVKFAAGTAFGVVIGVLISKI